MSVEMNESPRHEPQMFQAESQKAQARLAPAAEVGYFLHREREARGLTIEEASEATGIHPYHIDAIEMGDLTHMPQRLEAIEMIAGYAQWLGFEPEPLVDHLASFLPPPPVAPRRQHPANPEILSSAKVLRFGKMPKVPGFSLSRLPGGTSGVVTSVAAAFVLLFGAHWALSHHAGQAPGETAQVAEATPAASAAPAVKITDEKLATGDKVIAVGTPDDPDGDMGAFIDSQVKDDPKAADATKLTKPAKPMVASTKMQDRIKVDDQIKTASTSPIPAPSEGHIYGAENKDAHVILKALGPVWLRIEDAQGNAVMTQMLNTGDTYRVPNREGLVALSRDGSRLAFLIDGQEKGVLGAPGKILVGEKLDVAALEAKK